MWHVTLKSLFARKVRLFGTSLAVVLGVAFMAGSLILTATMNQVFDNMFASAFKSVDAQVRSVQPVGAVQGQDSPRPPISADLIPPVASVPGVSRVRGDINEYAQIISKDGKPIGNPGNGAPTFGSIWDNDPKFNPFNLYSGTAPANDTQLVMDRESAKKGKFHPGDPVTVITNNGAFQFTVSGIAKFGSADSPGGASFVLMTENAAQHSMLAPGLFGALNVAAQPGMSQQTLKDNVAKVVPAGKEVITGATLIKENQDALKTGLKFFSYFLLAFGAIALFVGAFIINNTFSILMTQRQREYALLRALGASRRQVMRSGIAEALAIGIIASVLGIIGGIAMAYGLKALLSAFGIDIPSSTVVITSSTIIISVVVGTGVSVISGYLPARRGSKVPPIAALRDVAYESRAASARRIISGVVVLGIGATLLLIGLFAHVSSRIIYVGSGVALVFVGVAVLGPVIASPVARLISAPLPQVKGITGDLARENSLRNPRRTARTASALVVGVSLVVFISVFAGSAKASINHVVDTSFTGDLVILGPQTFQGGLPTTLGQQIATLPEVKQVSPVRDAVARVDGTSTMLSAIDPASFVSIFDVDVQQGNLQRLGETEIAVSKKTMDDKGWKLGQTVPVEFSQNGIQQMTIVAVYKQTTFADFMVGLPAFDRNVTPKFDTVLMVTKSPNVSTSQLRTSVERVAAVYPTAKVQDQSQYKADIAKQVDRILNLIYVLLALAIIIALLGIANTLMLSIFERTRELGLLRAVGMNRRQVRSMVRWESVITALLGTLQGLIVGVLFGWALQRALADQGFNVLSVPIGQLLAIVVIGFVAGVLAAMWPARRAANLDILKAVATE